MCYIYPAKHCDRVSLTVSNTYTFQNNSSYHEQLTGEDGWHESTEHEEQHAEEQTASVVVRFAGLVADAEIKKTNENANTQVRQQAQASQRLHTMTQQTLLTPLNPLTTTVATREQL